jgi:membrane-bound lytic murein transglycosylase D
MLGPAVALLAGCASVGPPPAGPEPDLVEATSPAADALAEANSEYLEGVRAYVREDLRAAEKHFHRVQEELAFAGSEEAALLDARDAETLLAKSEYFLEKIAERSLEPPVEVAEEEEEEVVEAGPPDWTVVHGSIEPKHNKDVERWMSYFLNDGRTVFQKWLDRKPAYEPVFDAALARRGLPRELQFHSMIESGFSPHAYSWAHAVGLWQFVRATGRRYGLRSDWWVDERRDPVRATEAAAQYLEELYVEFQDWELALAAYNVGEGRVRKQIARQRTRDFWSLRLPRETRNHIPKFYAALILGSDPEAYGFSRGRGSAPQVETVNVEGCVDFDVLAECAGTDAQTLADLNPALVRRCTPPDSERWDVLVPAGTAERAQVELAKLPEDHRVRWAHHVVHRGETLSRIASRYRTSVDAIVEANRLRSRNRLRVGQDLLIPQGRPSGANAPRIASAEPRGAPRRASDAGDRPTSVHTVRRGDTLSTIAQRYGTSTAQIRKLNRIGRHIYPGQRITVPVRSKPRIATNDDGEWVRVRPGDTIWGIAQRTGVSVTALLRENNLRRNSLIRAGQRLRIPGD